MSDQKIIFIDSEKITEYEFEKNKEYRAELDGIKLSEIKLSLAVCRAELNCAETENVTVVYTTSGSAVGLTAENKDGRLTVTEKMKPVSFFGSFKSPELTLTVPKRLYSKICFELASGRISMADITCGSLKADIASGSAELSAYAADTDINIASGRAELTNCTKDAAEKVKVNVASGNVIMTGYRAGSTQINIASGNLVLDGISGVLQGSLASGKLTASFAEWNGEIRIKLMSGSADIKLPAGSGVSAQLERLSGSLSVDLDGQSGKLTSNSRLTIGGKNVHDVKAETASGNIRIHN